jgi:hypothetical protein
MAAIILRSVVSLIFFFVANAGVGDRRYHQRASATKPLVACALPIVCIVLPLLLGPVATLGPFFSVGLEQTKHVSFRFGDEIFTVNMTHFENNTHRVRLRPLRDIERPAIVIFRRVGEDEYHCSVADSRDYARLLAEKCSEQTRSGARRWGLE